MDINSLLVIVLVYGAIISGILLEGIAFARVFEWIGRKVGVEL